MRIRRSQTGPGAVASDQETRGRRGGRERNLSLSSPPIFVWAHAHVHIYLFYFPMICPLKVQNLSTHLPRCLESMLMAVRMSEEICLAEHFQRPLLIDAGLYTNETSPLQRKIRFRHGRTRKSKERRREASRSHAAPSKEITQLCEGSKKMTRA